MTVYSIGYQGTDLHEFIHVLTTYNIDIVVDVRLTPWSRKPGFSKIKLSSALRKADIEYVHIREAGNPKEIRDQYNDIDECLRMYKAFLIEDMSGPDALRHLLEKEPDARICLMCFERSPSECHRSVLLEVLSESIDQETYHIDAVEQASCIPA